MRSSFKDDAYLINYLLKMTYVSKRCQKTGYYYEDVIFTLADLEFWIARKILDKKVFFFAIYSHRIDQVRFLYIVNTTMSPHLRKPHWRNGSASVSQAEGDEFESHLKLFF